jgi:hypothetical protein
MNEDEINTKYAADTIRAATTNGLTNVVEDDDGHTLCGNDEGEIVDVAPDGSWEYMGIREDKTMRTMAGPSAALLAGYLQSEENKVAMEEHYAETDDQPEGESE